MKNRLWKAALLLFVAACSTDPSAPAERIQLQISVSVVADSAALGSSEVQVVNLNVAASGATAASWNAAVRGGSPWLALSESAGTTPTDVEIRLNPSGLLLDTYADTIDVTLAIEGAPTVAVPVVFVIEACAIQSLTVGSAVAGALEPNDCGAPHRTSRFADIFSFTGSAGDSISLIMSSPVLDAYLILDTMLGGSTAGLVQSNVCPTTTSDACVIDFLLLRDGTYYVEATSALAGEVGTYALEAAAPRAPAVAADLGQFRADSSTPILVGANAGGNVLLGAQISDPDRFGELRLDVEVQPTGTPFTGTATATSDPVVPDSVAFVEVTGLGASQSYHWQARVTDHTGRWSSWLSFGGNGEQESDFTGSTDELPPTFGLIAEGLTLPLLVTSPPVEIARAFIVEQGGRVLIFRDDSLLTTPFLDLSAELTTSFEQGLLGLAFHPNYASNGEFFVNHTGSDGDTRVVRYRVSADPDIADVGSADTIITLSQPSSSHNGGHVAFGPDGMLYVSVGDGGGSGDPFANGQNRATPLGAIMRVDVDGGTPYAIPPDNPFAGDSTAAQEIWLWGLRNPWRFSFDRTTGDLYVADVGQNQWEEVNVLVAGAPGGVNFGWNTREGAHCFDSATCDQAGLTDPIFEYDHGEGCSIAGGFVYRGSRVPILSGHYLYSDYCSGWIRSFQYNNAQITNQSEWPVPFSGNVTSFGEDSSGDVYVTLEDGRVYMIQ